MLKNKKSIRLFYPFTAALVTLVGVVLRTVALLTEYEADIEFYASPSLAIATAAILVAAGLTIAHFGYQLRDRLAFSPDYRDLPSLISGVYLAVSLLFLAATLVLGALSEPPLALAAAILTAVFAVGSTPIFVLRAFDGRVGTALNGLLTLPAAAACVLFALYLSFEDSVMLTSPAKLLATAAWVFASFFFLGEARIALGRAKWALHLSVTAATVILAGTLSLPNLVYHAVSGAAILGNTAHDFAAFGLFLYASARFAAILSSPAEAKADTADRGDL